MDSQNHYSVLSKRAGREDFRLLVLEPGQPGDQIICELHNVSLADVENPRNSKTYEAVSHVWGSKEPLIPVRVGARPVPVRENLYDFLNQVRDPDNTMTLWIDALW